MKYFLIIILSLTPLCHASNGGKVDYQEKILGKWSCDITTKEKETLITMSLDVDYIRNGRSNTFGTITLDVPSQTEGRLKFDYSLTGSGKWEIKDNKYLVEIIEEVKTVNLTNPLADQFFKLDNFFPKNLSSSSEIIKINDSDFITKNESDGKTYTCKKKHEQVNKLKDSDNVIYLVNYNKNGAVLKNVSGTTIYVGNSCDSFSRKLGGGKWGHANAGVIIALGDKVLSFPNQKINIDGCTL